MQQDETPRRDSECRTGGAVPGLPGTPAFTLTRCEPSPIPVVVAVPHAGRSYPPALVEGMRHPGFAAPRLEDRLVDLVAIEAARRTGATLLVAQAPRAMIDLNRSSDDIDWDMIGGCRAPAGEAAASSTLRRARSGLGLVPRRLPGLGELWKRRIERGELDRRIAEIHAPYHAALAQELAAVRDRWGAALLIDLHSMPPLTARHPGEPAPQYVIGDRFGAACDGALVSSAFALFAAAGLRAAHNRPYAGGYVLERHARRREGIHALQLEIDRSSYLDARLSEPGEGFAAVVELVTALVRRIADEVAAIGRERQSWRAAAE
ncbi:N-formylglutamate amidohydrolase [Novosphingobium huizhouense]|uniref:N-formylglutamate amidohydrolase n=1 Tax=Novosphingobium huizhouense TaxID=2866625 RepID=UPI001CD8F6BF|nr:N-formylglutamate amidohydrolase [Novosphingobium huizhouense]